MLKVNMKKTKQKKIYYYINIYKTLNLVSFLGIKNASVGYEDIVVGVCCHVDCNLEHPIDVDGGVACIATCGAAPKSIRLC